MLIIRLLRTGKRNQPFFKVVVTDKRRPPTAGRFVEDLGFWNPLTKKKNLKEERIKYWLSRGAKPSDTVYNLLISEKMLEGKKIPQHKKAKPKEEEKKEEAKPKVQEEKKLTPAEDSVKEKKPEEKVQEKTEEKTEEFPKQTSKEEEKEN